MSAYNYLSNDVTRNQVAQSYYTATGDISEADGADGDTRHEHVDVSRKCTRRFRSLWQGNSDRTQGGLATLR